MKIFIFPFTLLMGATSTNPLLSTIVTLYLLILLYFPQFFLISPLLISTLLLLLTLLRLGASQQAYDSLVESKCEEDVSFTLDSQPTEKPRHRLVTKSEPNQLGPKTAQTEAKPEQHCGRAETRPSCETESRNGPNESSNKEGEKYELGPVSGPKLCRTGSFVEWDVGAPLEVIYETYEGEENDDETQDAAIFLNSHYGKPGSDKYPSLSRYYPDSDTDTDMDTDSLISSLYEDYLEVWDTDEEKEGVFEIAIDDHGCIENYNIVVKKFIKEVEVDDEDNLIEIDISPTRTNSDFSW